MSEDISEAMEGQAFDPSTVPDAGGFEPIPAGWYPCQIENAEVKDTKKGDGKVLRVELSIVGDNYAGRKLFPNFNLANPNLKAVEIGRRELANLCLAIGVVALSDSSELLGKLLLVKVTVRQEKDRDPDNEVKGYKAMPGAAAPAPAEEPSAEPAAAPAAPAAKPKAKPAAPAAAAATKPATGKRPWER